LLFTVLAAIGFTRKLLRDRSPAEFYLLAYVAVLIMWSAQIGLRGLLPILPLYMFYGFYQLGLILQSKGELARHVAIALLMLSVGVSYAGEFAKEAQLPAEPDVQDPAAQELFAFLQTHTQPSETLIFSKPKTLALFTSRNVATLAFDQSAEDATNFMKTNHATILVKSAVGPPAEQAVLALNRDRAFEIFRNSDYQVFRFNWESNSKNSAELSSSHANTFACAEKM
jgi:hypothetical protein